jgi:hypothetical protein
MSRTSEGYRKELHARFTLEAKALEGHRIVKARYLTKAECSEYAWSRSTLVLVLDDGTVLFPMQDEEGNDAGTLMVVQRFGNTTCLPSIMI